MITENLRVNQLSDTAYEAYLAYLAALDARDVEAYGRFLADEVTMQFGNADPVVGKGAVTGMLAGYWQSFSAIEHDLTNIYGTDRSYVLEADNHYLRHDGTRVTVRAVAFTDKDEDGAVTSVRIYGDTSPVFARG
ncbi:MAG: nuclear transport factor 2 family protein [Pseudomonadota bacterium]